MCGVMKLMKNRLRIRLNDEYFLMNKEKEVSMNTDREQLKSLASNTDGKSVEIAAEWVDINSITEWENNPRKNDHAVKNVMESIKRFGFASPIIARKEDSVIIAGHTRLKAAKRLGLDRVPVRFLDLDPADAQMLAIADNKLSEIAEWDTVALAQVLNDLASEGLDLALSGFDTDELSELLDIDLSDFEEEEDENEGFNGIPDNVDKKFEDGDIETIGDHTIICGDCVKVMMKMDDNSVDSIVCDPPYGIDFMAKKWDASTPKNDWAEQAFRILKPGGHLIAFAATRTMHRLGTVIESANFEIRDTIYWVYASGFPKSMNIGSEMDRIMGTTDQRKVVGHQRLTGTAKPMKGQKGHGAAKATAAIEDYERPEDAVYIEKTAPASPEAIQWNGWGTALKPACEPAIFARKPLSEPTVAKNVLKWGTGAINVEDCRFPFGDECWFGPDNSPYSYPKGCGGGEGNIIITDNGDADWRKDPLSAPERGRFPANVYHCKKAQRAEREEGLVGLQTKKGFEAVNRKEGSAGLNNPRAGAGRTAKNVSNFHPTVKPVKLMRWLVKLVTPLDGTVLDTFCGSGTTMVASEMEGIKSIGIEMQPEYCDIIYARVKHACGE